MKVEILPKDSFQHGRQSFVRGERAFVNQVDAEDLERAGLVDITGDTGPDDLDDVLGDKMEPITNNRMMPAPDNKQPRRR